MALLSLVIRGDSQANMMSWLSIIRLVVASLGSHFLVSWSVRCVVRLILVMGHTRIPYAMVATTCAIPMRPSMSSGDTRMVSDLERVKPTVMRPEQSSVSSVGDLSA